MSSLEQWMSLWQSVCFVINSGSTATLTRDYHEMMDLWSAPGRTYRSPSHMDFMFKQLHLALSALPVSLNRHTVEAAIWFHDAVYIAGVNPDMNVIHSHNYWRWFSARHSLAAAWSNQVGNAIDATGYSAKCIKRTSKSSKFALESQLVCDLDLAILGQDPEIYAGYECLIRAEYNAFPDLKYAQARIAYLGNILKRDKIFNLDYFQGTYETQAHVNIKSTIERLRESLKTLKLVSTPTVVAPGVVLTSFETAQGVSVPPVLTEPKLLSAPIPAPAFTTALTA